ncbi:SCPDL [Enterospora canceri]|uniref:SCPDL n=1 Tax=Enterospora canceri TaxID=1081671 RepID=A0A1Y1S6Q4_9MICR|nr:SCPDL [Enterospora canceri]
MEMVPENKEEKDIPDITRPYDIVVYGASGFAAKYVIKQLEKSAYRVKLAARNASRIHKSQFDRVQANLDEIENVARECYVLINLAGPYTGTGESVVKACIRMGTDYVDITGEVGFMRKMLIEYDTMAKINGVAVIHSCGFDSIASDLGALHLAKSFDKVAIKAVLEVSKLRLGRGTWNSLLESMRSHQKHVRSKTAQTGAPFYTKEQDHYLLKYIGPDAFVVKKSAERLSSIFDYKFTIYLKVYSAIKLYCMLVWLYLINKLVQYDWIHRLLISNPGISTFGVFRNQLPTAAELKQIRFKMVLVGEGTRRSKRIVKRTTISGPDPGYSSCAIFVTECAYQLLRNKEKCVLGVNTPAVAFHKTDVIECIKQQGIGFSTETVSQEL